MLYFTMLVVTISFLHLAKNWPKLMQDWYTMEVSMYNYGWPRKLDFRLKVITMIIMSVAAGTYLIIFI